MKRYLISLVILVLMLSCDNTTQVRNFSMEVSVLPHPKEISTSKNSLFLSGMSKTYSSKKELQLLLQLFGSELEKLTGINVEATKDKNRNADIIFEIDSLLSTEEYYLNIDKTIQVTGGSYQALAMAKTTLLQLATKQEDKLVFPIVRINDYPDAKYRGLMIDLARQWHCATSIKQIIDLAAFYKINYLHLHFTDDKSYTLPSKKYTLLATPDSSYSFEELKELEAYSQLRGVTIIPEIDVPGHSSPFVKMYPEIFAIKDARENPWIINMGNEEVYEALDHLIGEICEIFVTTPYFHIGGDEAIFNKVLDDPEVKAYMVKYGLGENVNELYHNFLIRMNDIIKKHNKQMCVWEGFQRDSKSLIPKDIVVFEFETNRYLPNNLVEDGYTVVNTSWKPLYIVNNKKWEPKTIYKWNMWLWQNWWSKAPSSVPIQINESPLVIGAQMCTWDQPEILEIPSLRKRLPAFIERIWNTKERIAFGQFMIQLEQSDKLFSILINDNRQDSLLIGYNFSE